MLIASAQWKKAGDARDDLWRRAWTELQRVGGDERDKDWKSAARAASAHADYPAYRALAEEWLGEPREDFWLSQFLPNALSFASKNKDWTTFDRWLERFEKLPEPLRVDHAGCAVLNLIGLRDVVALAPWLMFLSNDDVSALAKRMRSEGRATALCDELDAITKKKDWRLLQKMS